MILTSSRFALSKSLENIHSSKVANIFSVSTTFCSTKGHAKYNFGAFSAACAFKARKRFFKAVTSSRCAVSFARIASNIFSSVFASASVVVMDVSISLIVLPAFDKVPAEIYRSKSANLLVKAEIHDCTSSNLFCAELTRSTVS